MKSEVEHEENEEFQQYYERNMLTCFGCNFETENIDELDEHILINHDGDETEPVEQKYQIVADEEEEEVSTKNSKYMNKQVKTTTRVDIPNRKIPRGKIIIRPRETKFEICNDTKFSVDDDDDLDPSPPKRAKRTPAEEMKCHLCPFITQKKSVLSTHMLNHSDVIPPVYFKCSQCPYQTKRKNDMPKHMLGHCSNDSVPLYKCQYCPYVTKRKGDLPKHEMNHVERDKIFSWNCTECEYSSKRKNDLHKHMLVHSDRQLTGVFKCLKCAYATDKVVKFSRHVLSKCQVWDEPISLEHLMLEDILASVDKNGVHVVLDADSDGEVHVRDENVQYVEEEAVEYIEYIEGVEEPEGSEGAVVIEGEIVEEDYIQCDSNEHVEQIQEETEEIDASMQQTKST